MGTRSADVLRLTGAEVEVIERCSAVDGTWGMKKEYFELSMKLAEPLFTGRRGGRARPRRHRLPARRAADQPGHRADRAAPHPDPRRGLRARSGAPGVTAPIRLADVLNFFEYEKVREDAAARA